MTPRKPGGADPPPAVRARYHSPLRDERAADTRRRIAAAARELFTDHGFAGTTVTRIAQNAGVSDQTVYACFGSKGAIMRALLMQFEEDADAAGWRARIASEPSPHRKLEAFAQWSRAFFASSKQTIALAQSAAGDPALIELREQGDRHRREALVTLVSGLTRSGVLRPGLGESQAVDRAWMLTGVELYVAATDGCGWSDSEYASWLADLLRCQLLTAP